MPLDPHDKVYQKLRGGVPRISQDALPSRPVAPWGVHAGPPSMLDRLRALPEGHPMLQRAIKAAPLMAGILTHIPMAQVAAPVEEAFSLLRIPTNPQTSASHVYQIMQGGEQVGDLSGVLNRAGRMTTEIQMDKGPGALGIKNVFKLYGQMLKEEPDIQRMVGLRTTGARFGPAATGNPNMLWEISREDILKKLSKMKGR